MAKERDTLRLVKKTASEGYDKGWRDAAERFGVPMAILDLQDLARKRTEYAEQVATQMTTPR